MEAPDTRTTRVDKPLSRRAIVQQLKSLQQSGVTHVPRRATVVAQATDAFAASRLIAPPDRDTSRPAPTVESEGKLGSNGPEAASREETAIAAQPAIEGGPGSLIDPVEPAQPVVSRPDRVAALSVIQQEVARCTRCDELASTRSQTVFGVGNPEARLCFLGEAPGADEDRQGEPFVGRAGQLLNKIIEACGMRREDVYILNVLKCRPPGNRNPLPDEAANCRGFLDGQLEIIRPEFICCLGAVAARMLLDTPAPIGKLRRKFFNYGTSQVLCTYHPAFLLRNPSAKKEVWQDMQLLMERMGMLVRQGRTEQESS